MLQAALPSVSQQVSGRIVRPGVRDMEPMRNVWVTLHRVGPDSAGPLDSIKSDARGRYSFKYTRTGSNDAVYFVSASFDGIAYFTSPPANETAAAGKSPWLTRRSIAPGMRCACQVASFG